MVYIANFINKLTIRFATLILLLLLKVKIVWIYFNKETMESLWILLVIIIMKFEIRHRGYFFDLLHITIDWKLDMITLPVYVYKKLNSLISWVYDIVYKRLRFRSNKHKLLVIRYRYFIIFWTSHVLKICRKKMFFKKWSKWENSWKVRMCNHLFCF